MKALRIIPTCRSKLLVCFAVREVLLAKSSQRYIASVSARSSQIPHWCPHDEKANYGSSLQRRFNQHRKSPIPMINTRESYRRSGPSPTQWSNTLPVIVGESLVFQQACGRLHSSCETHFGSTKGDGNGSDVGVTHLTSKNSGSELVTRLIIWSTHHELFLRTMRRTVTIAQSSTPQSTTSSALTMLSTLEVKLGLMRVMPFTTACL